jgi:hypothetical protein
VEHDNAVLAAVQQAVVLGSLVGSHG